ncbi:MAG TPA: integrase, partial [bacterium]
KNISDRSPQLSQRGRKKQYRDPVLLDVLRDLWVATNLPCSKRLKAIIPLWLPYYEMRSLSAELRQQLFSISAATMDRLMAPLRARYHKQGLATTKPGSLLRKHIPISTDQWDETMPGFIEVDTVAHCGTSTEGMFVYTINCVDIATAWTEQRAIWGKGETGVVTAMRAIESHLPFPLQGFDCDNGSEFLNWHRYRHFTERKAPVKFTRSRPYKKNDNAHVEEKNYTQVRLYLGYQRFDKPELVAQLNELFANDWNQLLNFFMPSSKLLSKYRDGAHIKKLRDNPQTPVQRILASLHIPAATKQRLQQLFEQLNPFELYQQLARKIKAIIKQVNN